MSAQHYDCAGPSRRTSRRTSGPCEDDGRSETPNQRLDRNWEELLQELRVAQTGTQLIAGFLLSSAGWSTPATGSPSWCWPRSRS